MKGEIEFDENYWDCECEKDFIHPKTQKHCKKCGVCSETQPPSRVDEIKEATLPASNRQPVKLTRNKYNMEI